MTHERKIRMATADAPQGQGHTIVGGRPSGRTHPGTGIPRTLEILMKKAALDGDFAEQLVSTRLDAVKHLGLVLDPAEKAMLQAMPTEQLRLLIRHTPVPEPQKPLLKAGTTAALLTLLAQLTFGQGSVAQAQQGQNPPVPPTDGDQNFQDVSAWGQEPVSKVAVETGVRPDVPEVYLPVSRGISPDHPFAPGGIRPDYPDEPEPQPGPSLRETPPAPESPATSLSDIYSGAIKTATTDLSFHEAITAIEEETGAKISFGGLSDQTTRERLSVDVSGLSLGRALRKLCQAAGGANALYQITTEGKTVTIIFRSASSSPPEVLPVENKPPLDLHTKGIRPDFPGKF